MRYGEENPWCLRAAVGLQRFSPRSLPGVSANLCGSSSQVARRIVSYLQNTCTCGNECSLMNWANTITTAAASSHWLASPLLNLAHVLRAFRVCFDQSLSLTVLGERPWEKNARTGKRSLVSVKILVDNLERRTSKLVAQQLIVNGIIQKLIL